MFVRVKSTPNSPRKSIQIVENVRKGDKVSQKILRYVGIAHDDNEEQQLRDMAREIMVKLKKQQLEDKHQLSLFDDPSDLEIKQAIKRNIGRPQRKRIQDILPTSQVQLDDIEEVARVVDGVHEVAGELYNDIYANLLKGKNSNRILKDLVLARLVQPASKHKTQKVLSTQFNINHNLDAIYRTMDSVYDKIDTIKQITFAKTQALFPKGVDLLLFDVTTLYFESIETDELRQFGYSKDHRFNTTQLVLALATNSEGLPVGYELFEGNKAEVKTLIEAIEKWQTLFHISKVCFVGDRAMMSKDNLNLLEQKGYEYIIAAKLRSMPKDVQSAMFNDENYRPTLLGDQLAWVGEFEYQSRRLIVSYKKQRALKDSKERQQVLDKINKRLGQSPDTKKLITNQGVRKYTKTSASVTTIDDDKVAADSQWDGLHGVITNCADQHSVESIIMRYASLWRIEESFRINKHTLKMRPIFHFKPERIKAHIAICYMAFALLRHLQYQVQLCQKLSIDTIIEELLSVQSSIHQHKVTKDLYRLPGVFSHTAKKIYKAFNIQRNMDASIYLP